MHLRPAVTDIAFPAIRSRSSGGCSQPGRARVGAHNPSVSRLLTIYADAEDRGTPSASIRYLQAAEMRDLNLRMYRTAILKPGAETPSQMASEANVCVHAVCVLYFEIVIRKFRVILA